MGSTKPNRNLTRRASSSADTSTRSASATTGISSIRIVSKRMRAGTLPVSAHNRDKGSGIPSDDGERNAAIPDGLSTLLVLTLAKKALLV